MKKKIKEAKKAGSRTEVELVFDGGDVRSQWYHPDLAKVLCSLCGKGCEGLGKCVSVNPYCG